LHDRSVPATCRQGSCNLSDAARNLLGATRGIVSMISTTQCGCDGKTYRNSCYRHAAGMSKKSDGHAQPPTEGQTVAQARSAAAHRGELRQTGSFATCRQGPATFSDATGTCVLQCRGGCITIYQPVCGLRREDLSQRLRSPSCRRVQEVRRALCQTTECRLNVDGIRRPHALQPATRRSGQAARSVATSVSDSRIPV